MMSDFPFGLLFLEIAPPQEPEQNKPIYVEKEGMLYIKDEQGHLVPYIEEAGPKTTQTVTRIRTETTDSDETFYNPSPIGTQTATKIRNENTDTD